MRIFTRHLLAVLLPVLFTAAAVSGWYVYSLRSIGTEHTFRDAEHLRAGLYKEFEEHARSVAKVAAEALISPLLYGDLHSAGQILDYLRGDPDVLAAYLVGADGRIRHDGTAANKAFNHNMEEILHVPFSPHGDEHWDEARERLTILTPVIIEDHVFGEVALVLSTTAISGRLRGFDQELRRSFDTLYRRALLSLLLLGLGLVSACSLLAWILARRLTGPIAELAATVRNYRSTGQLPQSAARKRNDEIGDLARTLDDTVRSLRQTTVSRDLLHSILETLRDAVLILDDRGIVLSANASAREIFGPKRPEHSHIAELFDVPEDQADSWWRKICTAPIGDKEEVSLPGAFDDRILLLSCAPLGDFGGYILAASDISERSRLQQATMRTEKMASVGGLAAGMAHEINNPLGVMMQSAQLTRRRLDPSLPRNRDTAREIGLDLDKMAAYLRARSIDRYLEGMIEAGARAAAILNDMIRFSRPDESAYQPQSVNNTLDAALGAVLRDGSGGTRWGEVDIVKDYASPMPAVPYSGSEIEQVFINLLRNAFQAASDAAEGTPPRVSLHTRFENGHAVATIEDNGPGMDENTHRRALEPFYTTRSVGQGTGLGLSLAYYVVTAHHGGDLDVRSAPGRTIVTVRLPLSRHPSSGPFRPLDEETL